MKNRILIYLSLIPFALILFILVTNLIVHIGASSRIYKDIKDVKVAQTALVLGAAVHTNGDLSPVYKERVDKAFELYKTGKVSKILASGDNSTVEHNEVNPVRNYLIAKGVPDGDIYLDHAGFDTYSTMYRARDIFKVSGVVVVTQSFHLPRAVFIARALGIDAYGVRAGDEHVKISNYIREIFANEKAIWNLVWHRQPKYLGKAIPIDEEKEPTQVPKEEIKEVDLPPHSPKESEDEPVIIDDGDMAPKCIITGCSGQICSDQERPSTCEFRPEYACYAKTTCKRQPSGQCGWTANRRT